MPTIATDAARTNYKFKGFTVGVPSHYAVGHTMDEKDVRFANKQLASVTGNVLASAINRKVDALQKVEDAKPEAERRKDAEGKPYVFTEKDLSAEDVQALYDTIYAGYEIGVNNAGTGGGGAAHDPVESIANNIAWERVKAKLKEKGYKVASVKADKKAQLVKSMRDKDASILETAKAMFNGTGGTDGLDDLFAGIEKADAKPADAPEVADTNAPVTTDDSTPTTEAATPDSEPSSTAETNGETSADNVTSPSNPGTLGTTEEGTGQGTPEPIVPGADAVTDDTTGAIPGAVNSGAGIPDSETSNTPPAPGAFA